MKDSEISVIHYYGVYQNVYIHVQIYTRFMLSFPFRFNWKYLQFYSNNVFYRVKPNILYTGGCTRSCIVTTTVLLVDNYVLVNSS